jgi:hypothetical protein
MLLPKLGFKPNLGTYYKKLIGKYLVNIPLLTTHNTTHEVWSLDFGMEVNTFTIKPLHLLW